MSTVASPIPEISSMPLPVGAPTPSEPIKPRLPIMINDEVLIPEWVVDHESYRRWAYSDGFPTSGRVSFIDGMIWMETTMEEFYAHNQVKRAYNDTLSPLIRAAKSGYYVPDGCLWTNAGAGISTEADALFFTYDALKTGRIRHVESKKGGYLELDGTPDMTLEIVSSSSVSKDTVILKDKCAKAGVAEYWLVDARSAEPSFQIWRLHEGSYQLADVNDGWLTSVVFGKAFKLEHGKDELGHPEFQLLAR
jgi:Uma2 family endonuclease